MSIEISVVMPVFNGELFLPRTLDSLSNQSFQNFEVICINDASTDKSLSVLNNYKEKLNLKIIDIKSNIGRVPYIIKSYGIPNINGQYFIYLSQDDFLSDDCFEKSYSKAIQFDADAVIPDFVYYTDKSSDKKIIGLNGDHEVVLSGLQAFIYSLDWSIPGAALWRNELVKRVDFEDFNMYADEYTVRKFFLASRKVTFSEGTIFYRVDNPDSITKRMKPALFSKVFKEAKLLELVFWNADTEMFKVRLENLVNMFFDYFQILLAQGFSKKDLSYAKEEMKIAFAYFNKFSNSVNYNYKASTNKDAIKYHLLRFNYFVFYLVCKVKYLFRH